MTLGRANAGLFDSAQGRVAEPGTSLYALDRGLKGIVYADSGEGRVVKIQAKKMPQGELRVTIQRVYIPENYIAKTHAQTLEVERNWKNLERLAGGNRWVAMWFFRKMLESRLIK